MSNVGYEETASYATHALEYYNKRGSFVKPTQMKYTTDKEYISWLVIACSQKSKFYVVPHEQCRKTIKADHLTNPKKKDTINQFVSTSIRKTISGWPNKLNHCLRKHSYTNGTYIYSYIYKAFNGIWRNCWIHQSNAFRLHIGTQIQNY